MAKGIKWEIVNDNTQKVIKEVDVATRVALEAMGLQCSSYAVLNISGNDGHPRRVDTGNLRNSISHKVVPNEEAVYIGTDVEYATYVHEGTSRMAPNRFLRDAAKDHTEEYKKIAEQYLKGQ